MFKDFNPAQFNSRNVVIWMTLSFQAGAINSGGFFSCHRFVTHTTGFATFFGAEAANGKFGAALGMLMVPMFFLLGAMVAGVLIDQPQLLGKPPRWKEAMFINSGLLLFITIAGITGHLGAFGEPTLRWRDYLLLATLCFVSGLQNASVSRLTSGVIRTTHLTGITTDLGIGFVRQLRDIRNSFTRNREFRNNLLRIGIISSFVLGSLVASVLFLNAEFYGFFLPLLTSMLVYFYSLQAEHN